MSSNQFDDLFLDYIEGALDEETRKRFEAALAEDVALAARFARYQRVLQVERALSAERSEAPVGFQARIEGQLSEGAHHGFVRRLFMKGSTLFVRRSLGLGSLAVAILAIVVTTRSVETPPKPVTLPAMPGVLSYNDSRIAQSNEATFPATVPTEEKDIKEMVAPPPPGLATSAYNELRTSDVAPQAAAKQDSSRRIERAIGMADLQGGGVQLKTNPPTSNFALSGQAETRQAAPGMHDEFFRVPGSIDAPMVQPIVPGERFASVTENRRLFVRDVPLSTFGADVDAASYAIARRYLQMGNLPPVDSVRIEEFVNAFDYDYPVERERAFGLTFEIAPSPLEPDRHLLRLALRAKTVDPRTAGWNLVFLVDVSGSMDEPNKLPLVKRSLELVVERMRPVDRIAIVTYAGWSGVVLPSTSGAEKARIRAALNNLVAGGGTAGAEGIRTAYSLASQNLIQGGVNRVILATDGDFNVGIQSIPELKQLIEAERERGVTLTTLGFGTGNIRDDVMEQLADAGNGNYFYIDSFREARRVLETGLTSTVEVVAKDVKFQIEFNPQHVSAYRLIGYDNRRLRDEDFGNDRVDSGDIGSGHSLTVLYEIALVDSPFARQLSTTSRYQGAVDAVSPVRNDKPEELGFLKVRYKEPEGHTSSLLEFPIARAAVKSDPQSTSNDFRFVTAVQAFGHLLRKSEFAGRYTFAEIARLAESALGEDRSGQRREFVELVRSAASLSPNEERGGGAISPPVPMLRYR